MTTLDPCPDCATCTDCGRPWCRDLVDECGCGLSEGFYIAAHPNGQSAHDTEAQAMAAAREYVNSRTAKEVVVYMVPALEESA